jgi:plasmid stabilization system protein ParE
VEIVFTQQAIKSLDDSLFFLNITSEVTFEKAEEIKNRVYSRISTLKVNPYIGQVEPLMPRSREYRRLIESSYKIIYYVADGTVYITDIFDSRQNPTHMKG